MDAALRTSDPDIFAAGDVANALHPVTGEHARSEHWANAIAGGKVAGRSMLGKDAVLDDIPYFYTDQFDLGMEYSGYAALTNGRRAGDPGRAWKSASSSPSGCGTATWWPA